MTNTWEICNNEYNDLQQKKRKETAEINNKLQNKINKMFAKLDR